MNKQEKKVYNWLMLKPGYLRKKQKDVYKMFIDSVAGGAKTALSDFKLIMSQATLDYKKGMTGTKAIKAPVVIKQKKVKNLVNNKNRNTPGTYLVTGCAHAPWQNKEFYSSVFNYINTEIKELQGLILAGDMLDLHSLSSHDIGKAPIKGVSLGWEYREANKFMDQLDQLNVVGTRDYIYGNHEDRYLRFAKTTEGAKMGDALVSPEEGLHLKDRGYNLYTNWKDDCIKLGPHLDVCHGEFCNVHSAKKTIDTYRKSTLYFHTHRFQIYIEGLVGGFNMGWGGDITAPVFGYATRAMKTSWVNSCALVNIDKDGCYHVQPLRHMNNKLIVNGREY